jgi:hypothetical protein
MYAIFFVALQYLFLESLRFFSGHHRYILYNIDYINFFIFDVRTISGFRKNALQHFSSGKPKIDLMQPIVIMTPAIPKPLDLRCRDGNIAAIRWPARVRGRSDISARNKFQP